MEKFKNNIRKAFEDFRWNDLSSNPRNIAILAGGITVSVLGLWATKKLLLGSSAPKNDSWESHVLGNSTLEQLSDRLWFIRGDGMGLKNWRNMVIYKMNNGGLLIHSAIALTETEQKKVEALGPIEVLIVPSAMHRMDAGVYKKRYPNIKVVCRKESRKAIEEVVAVDYDAEQFFAANPQYGVTVLTPPMKRFHELVYDVELNNNKRAFIVNDIFFNLTKEHLGGSKVFQFGAWLFGVLNTDGKTLNISFGFRNIGFSSKDAMREFVAQLIERVQQTKNQGKDYSHLTLSHGNPLEGVLYNLKHLAKRI